MSHYFGPKVGPTSGSQRIETLDILRGFAILGILFMNIQDFSTANIAYFNPAAYGNLEGLNKWVWILSHAFTDLKFMSLFALLFGASIILLAEHAEQKGKSSLPYFLRRTFWLMVIGALHAYLIWRGDILFDYAICSLPLFFVRKWKPGTLACAAFLLILVDALYMLKDGISFPTWSAKSLADSMSWWAPDQSRIAERIEVVRNGWIQQLFERVPKAMNDQYTFIMDIPYSNALRICGLMLLGMALFKWGILTGQRSHKFYGNLSLTGMGIGLPLVVAGIFDNFDAGWSLENYVLLGRQYNYWGSLMMAGGYVGFIMLLHNSGHFKHLETGLAAIGRTALSNYLFQSIICTTIFYGYGFGLVGQIDRKGQVMIVMAILLAQFLISSWWLRHFHFGPAEWLWRSLTYWRLQPMLKSTAKPIRGELIVSISKK